MTRALTFAAAPILLIVFGQMGCMPPHHGIEHAGESSHGSHESARLTPRAPDPQLEEAARRVRVMPRNDLGCRLEVLGLVDVHEGVANAAEALDELKLRAAELGGEAVIGVDFEHGSGHEATHLSGMAVRCRDLLRGRSYDVIANVEVPGDMGHEDDAFRRLKEKGRELRADLLIDVGFDHGEAGNGLTKLRAKAIRFRQGVALP